MTNLKALAQNVLDIQDKIHAKYEAIQALKRSLEDSKAVYKEAEAALTDAIFDPRDEYDGPIAIDLGDKVLVCDWDSDGEGSWSMKAARKY